MIEPDNVRPRTLTKEAWIIANKEFRPQPTNISTVVNKCMAELQAPRRSERGLGRHFPWPQGGEHLRGVMWIGVPHVEDCWLEEGGGAWIILVRGTSGTPSSAYLRLCPSPPDAEVQFGFCPLRADHLTKSIEEEFPKGISSLSNLYIQSGVTSLCRMDKITVAIVSLAQPGNTTPAACDFRKLLGGTRVSDFLEDILRCLYTDSEGYQNILEDRDPTYRRLATLAVACAYPHLFKPYDANSLLLFTSFLGLTDDKWLSSHVWPVYYNVVMPEELFESAGRSLELGIPPLVPQYALPDTWMFNDRASEPCTSINGVLHINGVGRKILAGVVNRFNLDSPGRVSYWPFDVNPPPAWRAKVVECAKAIQSKGMPLDVVSRGDFALSEARQIPIFFCQDHNTPKFALLTKLEFSGDNQISSVETEPCNESGQLVPDVASDPTKEDPPAVATCTDCDSALDNSDSPDDYCNGCNGDLCRECAEAHDYIACNEGVDNEP
ncbi:hypothetical protein LCGC14_0329980 [marine sediment metagenome]|uniref:Uncharacterized protein n=1 Tax=marine sediment metagenome TaxID=412755 RepID=A0A0F9TGQ0_9ZZZZ